MSETMSERERQVIQLRLYLEAGTLPEALEHAKALVTLVERHAGVTSCRVERYWKITEYFGVELGLELGARTQPELVSSLTAALAPRWEIGESFPGDVSAVWDHRLHGHSAALPAARWAELQCFRRTDP